MSRKTAKTVPLTAPELALIKALRPALAAMMRAFDTDLRSEGLIHAEYLVLMFLSETPDRSMRLSDLAEACLQSPSAIGRTVQRLQAQGLVVREQSTEDARSFRAVLTDAGLARLEKAWPTHIDSVRRHLFDHLEGIDLGELANAFQRIAHTA